jgi:hypothetical protein
LPTDFCGLAFEYDRRCDVEVQGKVGGTACPALLRDRAGKISRASVPASRLLTSKFKEQVGPVRVIMDHLFGPAGTVVIDPDLIEAFAHVVSANTKANKEPSVSL